MAKNIFDELFSTFVGQHSAAEPDGVSPQDSFKSTSIAAQLRALADRPPAAIAADPTPTLYPPPSIPAATVTDLPWRHPGVATVPSTTAPAAEEQPPTDMPWRHQQPVVEGVPPALAANPPVGVTSETPMSIKGPGGPGTATRGGSGGSTADDFSALLAAMPQPTDRSGERADLTAQQRAALDEVLSNKDLNDDEKMATAILAVLPGILGAIGGGIAGGGVGAAQGLAGGLQGSQQGVGMILGGKEARRKEAKGDAASLQERISRLDQQIAEQREKSADRAFELKVRERAAQKAESLERQKMAQQERLAGAQMKQAEKLKLLDLKGEHDIAKLRADAAGAKGDNLKPDEKVFYTNAAAALDDIQIVKRLIGEGGANFSATISAPDKLTQLQQAMDGVARAYLKMRDPTSQTTPAEIASTKISIFGGENPTTTRTERIMAGLKQAEKGFNTLLGHRREVSPGLPVPPSAGASPSAQPGLMSIPGISWGK